MLINKLGTETDDEVVRLDDHRPTPDPKNRETMTTLLQVSLSAVRRSELLSSPPAPVSTLDSGAATDVNAASDVA